MTRNGINKSRKTITHTEYISTRKRTAVYVFLLSLKRTVIFLLLKKRPLNQLSPSGKKNHYWNSQLGLEVGHIIDSGASTET